MGKCPICDLVLSDFTEDMQALRTKLDALVEAGEALVGCMEARELRFCTDESAECFDVMMSVLDEIGGEK